MRQPIRGARTWLSFHLFTTEKMNKVDFLCHRKKNVFTKQFCLQLPAWLSLFMESRKEERLIFSCAFDALFIDYMHLVIWRQTSQRCFSFRMSMTFLVSLFYISMIYCHSEGYKFVAGTRFMWYRFTKKMQCGEDECQQLMEAKGKS